MGKENYNMLLAWVWLGNVCCNPSAVQKMEKGAAPYGEGLWKDSYSP